MKFNNYQKVVLLWGILLFLGFSFSQFLFDLRWAWIMWLGINAIALFFQFYLMWYDQVGSIVAQVSWLVVTIGGSLLTYIMLYGFWQPGFSTLVLWFLLCAFGMMLTGIGNKNNLSYFVLAALYVIAAVVFHFATIPLSLIWAGIVYLMLGIYDAYLEYSPWRKNMAELPGISVSK